MFKHLSEFIQQAKPLEEAVRPHPTLSDAELVKLEAKFDKLETHLEALNTILGEVAEDEMHSTAHKLHHIGAKGNFDMSYLKEAREQLGVLENTIMEMHQAWSIQKSTETGEFDEDDEAPVDAEAEVQPDDETEPK